MTARPIRARFILPGSVPIEESPPRYLTPAPDSVTWPAIEHDARPEDVRALLLFALEQTGFVLRPLPRDQMGAGGDAALIWLLDRELAHGIWRHPNLTAKGAELGRRVAAGAGIDAALADLERELAPPSAMPDLMPGTLISAAIGVIEEAQGRWDPPKWAPVALHESARQYNNVGRRAHHDAEVQLAERLRSGSVMADGALADGSREVIPAESWIWLRFDRRHSIARGRELVYRDVRVAAEPRASGRPTRINGAAPKCDQWLGTLPNARVKGGWRGVFPQAKAKGFRVTQNEFRELFQRRAHTTHPEWARRGRTKQATKEK